VRWIRRLCAELRPDVLHAHWLCGYAALAAVAGASPLVAMAWGSDVLRAGPVKTLANRVALRRARVAMADSRALLDRLVELGARRDRTVLVNWGVDLAAFAPPNGSRRAVRERLGLGPGPAILSPRSLTPVYNPRTILAAFARVAAAVPGAQLVLKHMGTDAPDLGTLPAAGDVRLVGHVPYEEMALYYQAADVCVSIPSSDSSPRSVWEAMACGCPVVLSDLPWVRELIVPGRDAVVVPVDAAAVAGGLLAVLGDGRRADALARRGRALAEAHRDREAEMDRLAGVYRALAA
jgi:glycosyltransferase involved in cell wall biosynthesis